MSSNQWFWTASQFTIAGVWILVISSLFWPDPTSFRSLCWLTLGILIVAHGAESVWFFWHHLNTNKPSPAARHVAGVFAFGLFYFVPYFQSLSTLHTDTPLPCEDIPS